MKRLRLRIRGLVQGVGFRPFAHRLALASGLSGWVRNDTGGVTLEVQGPGGDTEVFLRRLENDLPAAARIDAIGVEELAPEPRERSFTILASDPDGVARTMIGPDRCVCPACLGELFDPADRRHRYAFINCTECGPRYTIAACLPYDRHNTSMRAFPQCPRCEAEYLDPALRRFHAEPNACPVCGPQLRLLGADGLPLDGDPVAGALACLSRGGILALKGLGGFHLACDARDARAVARLRARKDREEKPLAVMAANIESLDGLVRPDPAACAALVAPSRPIVLLDADPACEAALAGVAPGLASLGVMLPYTPVHYLLFHEAAGRPAGTGWLSAAQHLLLVMTSANRHGEPLVIDNEEALRTLGGIADTFLLHDRDILIRCDDSVVRSDAAGIHCVRRGRGFTPLSLSLSGAGETVLALGGHLNAAPCILRGDEAFLAQHIGDLDSVANCAALEAAAEHLTGLLGVRPQALAHDLHPDFFSTRLAQRLADGWQLPAFAVQHHHAHVAAVLAEHRVDGPVLGLALDGVGLGSDGSPWGGELLRVDGAGFGRLGHLRRIGLPGGDRAAREPWRMGAAALVLMGRGGEITRRYADEAGAAGLARLAAGSPILTSSLGRWFDAAAGLLGVQQRMSFEGQAAMRLEGLARCHGKVGADPALYRLTERNGMLELDLLPLLEALCDERDAGRGAALFHAVLIQALVEWVCAGAESSGLRRVAAGGGCLQNAQLADGLRRGLEARGIVLLEAQQAPAGDGGLALGQAWVARHALAQSGGSGHGGPAPAGE